MAAPAFDLQSHSTYSDGALPPAEVVALAAQAGVELLALTDHDTIDGVDEALAAARGHGVRLCPATELSAVDGVYEDFHILGYGVDHRDAALRGALEEFRNDRHTRSEKMAGRLRELGFAVDEAPLRRRRDAGLPIGRPHLADAVLDHPDNRERLEADGTTDKNSFFPVYLVPGGKAFVARTHPTVYEAIDLIHAAGGVAVWAHPFWDLADDEEALATLHRFADHGIDGVECFYATHTREQTLLLHDACEERGLLSTGSADFHGPSHGTFATFRGFETYGREPRLGPIAGGC